MTKQNLNLLIDIIGVYNLQIVNCETLDKLNAIQKERAAFITSIYKLIQNAKS